MKEQGYFLPLHCLNSVQQESIKEVIERAKKAHYTNVEFQINGHFEQMQADWVKSMTLTTVERE